MNTPRLSVVDVSDTSDFDFLSEHDTAQIDVKSLGEEAVRHLATLFNCLVGEKVEEGPAARLFRERLEALVSEGRINPDAPVVRYMSEYFSDVTEEMSGEE